MKQRKVKLGRPPIPAEKRKGRVIRFRMSAAEAELLERVASECEVTPSELLRIRILNLSEREKKAIREGRVVITIDGIHLAT